MDEIKNGSKKLSIVSFICGIGGLSTFPLGFIGLIPSILAVVFANIARKTEPQNKLGTAGFVLGIIGFIFYASLILCSFIACAVLLNMLGAVAKPLY